ncbi:MAG TPA: hypothetical protein VLA21_05820 [Candidatus Limnocylindria bacterium]|nr:hypothetical protein [Candidatus Limnocylindria bacterium]
MRNHHRRIALALLALTLCSLPFAQGLAWKVSGPGTVVRGTFSDAGVTFKAPDGFVLQGITRGAAADEIVMEGPKDINGFIPAIHVQLLKEPIVLDSRGAGADLDFVASALGGTNSLCLVDERTEVNGTDAIRRIIFYNLSDKRMGVLCRYLYNLDGVGVMADYRARTATRSLPDDLAAMPALVGSLRFE